MPPSNQTPEEQLEKKIMKSFENLKHPVIMPECADFLLSQIDESNTSDEVSVSSLFREYFTHKKHYHFLGIKNTDAEKTTIMNNLSCEEDVIFGPSTDTTHPLENISSIGCCLPCSCVTLWGDRRIKQIPSNTYHIPVLLFADGLWVFWMEGMGILKILGVILDDFARNGKLPIPNDNASAMILEMMVRHVQMGNNSTVRDRIASTAQLLGWIQNDQRDRLDKNKTLINSAFSKLFHRFLILALYYYNQKRLAEAIKGTMVQPPSIATIVAIQDTISLLKNAMESFKHGRNYYNVLNAIVWIIASIDLIKRLRDTLGIPLSYERLDQIIPAAYSILVEKKSINTSEPNRFKLYFECAQDGRDILIDIAGNAFNLQNQDELKTWLNLVESRVEGYRASYLEISKVDLAKEEVRTEGALRIEQQI